MTEANKAMSIEDRIEAAEGPCRELDALIHCLAMPYCEMPSRNDCAEGSGRVLFRGKEFRHAKPYTASIDAAMTLVPEGLEWELFGHDAKRDPRFGRFQARIMLLRYEDDPKELGPQAIANAATPALALCAAALRARTGDTND